MSDPITAEQLYNSHRWFKLDELEQLPGNPNRGDEQSLTASLDEFGWIDGIVVHDGVVVAGNHRLQRAVDAGENGLPGYDLTAVVPDLPAARRMAMALAHNQTTRLGTDDDELLAAALHAVAVFDRDLAAVAVGPDLADAFLGPADISDFAPPLDGSPQLGGDMRFSVLVDVDTEQQQAALIDRLVGDGYTVRAVTT